MDALYEAGVRGFTDDGIPLMDEKLVEEAMKKAKELDVPISLHEEDPAYIKQPGVNQGKVSEQLNYGGASYLAEAVMVKRDCELAVKTGAKVDIQHISSGVAVDYVKEAKEKGANVYAEASPHHFTLTEEAVLKYGTLARMNPPLRTEEDRQRIIKGLQEGTIEIIATDHAPHSKEEKDKPLDQAPSGITGIETSLALGVTELVEKGYLSMMQLLEKQNNAPLKYARHPLVYLVEAADDICYQMMDIEDAHKLKILTTQETKELLLSYFSKERQAHRLKTMEIVSDTNEQIAYLRSSVIGLLIGECVQAFVDNEEKILKGEFEGSLINHISEVPANAYKHCADISLKKIYRSRDVLDIELAGFRIISTLLELMIDAVCSPEKAYSQLLINRVSGQYNIKAPALYERIQAVLDYISGMTDVFALDLYRKINGNSLPAV